MEKSRAGTIGPNAILQPVRLLEAGIGCVRAHAWAAEAFGGDRYVPPTEAIDERIVGRMHALVNDRMGFEDAARLLRQAGEGTAVYLLRHRIPRSFQRLERLLPSALALRLLAYAISRHAWTFVGTGDFRFASGDSPAFEIRNCPICRARRTDLPCCDFYTGTFSGLVRTLVGAGGTVREVECEALGQRCCRFEIDLKR